MKPCLAWLTWLAGLCAAILSVQAAVADDDTVLFGFETEADVAAWANIDIYGLREAEAKAAADEAAKKAKDPAKAPAYKPLAQPPKEPPVKIEWTTSKATRGQHALKLTFAGGRFPTISTRSPLEDWRKFKAFLADVTASRTCMVIFRAMDKSSKYGTAYNEGCSRWEFAARLDPGRNAVVARAPQNADPLWKSVQTVQIYMYQPHEGESITVENIRLSPNKPETVTPFDDTLALPPGGYKVLGTDWTVKDVTELAAQLKGQWTKPEDKTVEQIEAEVRAEYETIKAGHPKAVLLTLRDGRKGYDPADPAKPFAGWQDAGTPSHGPMALTMGCFGNSGKSERIETCFRNRPGFLRVDLSSIPKGAEILKTRLIVARSVDMGNRWATQPTLTVAEPCNRPWNEYEVNVFEYAKDKFWSQYAAMSWGKGGDCTAVLLAYGPSGGKASSWDFTQAVRYWTDGRHPNHGFILYGVPNTDYLNIFTRECGDIKNRPCLAVIYEPK